MANTSIQLKKSGVTGNTPSNLGYGELAINYADGKLYYKNDLGSISYINNQDTFSTVMANSVPLIASGTTDILSIIPSTGISVIGDGIVKTVTLSVKESELTTFVKKSGDTMSGNLYLPTSNVESKIVIVDEKLYAGIASRVSTVLPNVIAQFASNSASYVQVNQQNIDELGSADFVVTADVGSDTDFYIDMGLNNSQYVPGSYNGLGTAGYPLDGYLVVQGSTIGQLGGNLVIGTVTTGTDGLSTKIVAGGSNTEHIIVEFREDQAHVYKDLFIDGTLGGPTINNTISLAQAAFDKANTGDSAAIAAAFSQANSAYDQANAAIDLAQSAYDYANTIGGFSGNLVASSVTSNTFISLPSVVRSTGNVLISNTEPTLIDSFDPIAYRSGRYSLQISAALGFETVDLSVIYDGVTTQHNTFNSFYTYASLGAITTSFDGLTANVYYTPLTSPTSVIFVKDMFASVDVGLPQDLMYGSGTIDLMTGAGTIDLQA